MRIAIAADHNGLEVKARLVARLTAAGHDVDDRPTEIEHGRSSAEIPALHRAVGLA